MVSVILLGCSVGSLAAGRMAPTNDQLVDRRPPTDTSRRTRKRHIRSYVKRHEKLYTDTR